MINRGITMTHARGGGLQFTQIATRGGCGATVAIILHPVDAELSGRKKIHTIGWPGSRSQRVDLTVDNVPLQRSRH